MSDSNPFYSKMDSLTNEELLKVIRLKDDYQPEAFAAAEEVMKNRNLSEEVIEEIHSKHEEEVIKEKERKDKTRSQVNDLLKVTSVFTLGVSTEFESKQIKGLKFFIIGLTAYFIFYVFSNYTFISSYLYSIETFFDPIILEILIHVIIFPIAIYQFAKLKEVGWRILLYFFITKAIFHLMLMLFYFISEFKDMIEGREPSLLDDLISQPNHLISIVIILTYGRVVWYLLKPALLKLYKIDSKSKKSNIISGIAIAIVYIAYNYFGFI